MQRNHRPNRSIGIGFLSTQVNVLPSWTFSGKRCWSSSNKDNLLTTIEEPTGNAANAKVKIFELSRADRNTIKRALLKVMK